MSAPIELIAILYPKEGKVDRVVELLDEMSSFVKNNEPGTLKYHIMRETNKKSGVEEVVMFESYESKEALGKHGGSKEFKDFNKKMQDEGLIASPMQLKFLKNAGGFGSRL